MDDVDSGILHQGWITKSPPLEGHQQHTIFKARWRRRWFTLQQGKLPDEFLLNYYSDETKRKLKGTISLDEVEQVDIGLTAENGKHKYEFMFDIKTPDRTYYLAVDTKDDMTTWVRMICSTCGLQSTKDEAADAAYSAAGTAAAAAAVPLKAAEAQQPTTADISSPYIHISTCYSGTKPPPKPERTAIVKHSSSNSSTVAPSGLVVMPPPQVSPLPEPHRAGPPPRPAKPPHLAPPATAAVTSQQPQPQQNYANSNEMQELCLNEQNNNRGRPEVTRVHKPGRNSNFMQAGMSLTLGPPSSVPRDSAPSHSATLGPPVKRNLKPKSPGFTTGDSGRFHSLGRTAPSSTSSQGASAVGQRNRHLKCSTTSEFPSDGEGSNSETESRRNSGSEEQIYFYMPPATATPGGQLMIPADSFEHPSLSYIDLDLKRLGGGDTKPPPKKNPEKETIYKEVDFEKTEAFNRTKQVVESERAKAAAAGAAAALDASFCN